MTAPRSKSRAEILSAAARAIARDGFHGMTMRGLARDAGLGLATAYDHFSSKDDILFQLQREAFDELLAEAERATLGCPTPEAALRAFIEAHVGFVARRPDVMRILVLEAGALGPGERARIRGLKDRYFALLRGVVARLASAHGRDADPAELERETYALFGMLNWTFGWYAPARHGLPAVVARTLTRVALDGLGGSP